MSELKIMNWNIQSFGKKRGNDPDRVSRVARVIDEVNPGLFTIIELVQKNPEDAIKICKKIVQAMHDNYGKTYQYIITHANSTGHAEIYPFFYDASLIEPVCVAANGTGDFTTEQFVVARNMSSTIEAQSKLTNYFPLFSYLDNMAKFRKVGMGFFRFINDTSKYFCLMAWHNMAGSSGGDDSIPKKHLKLFGGNDFIKNKQLPIHIPAVSSNPLTIDNIIVCGDFNVNYLTEAANYGRWLRGYKAALYKEEQMTYLKAYKSDEAYSSNLGAALYDNFLYHFGSGGLSINEGKSGTSCFQVAEGIHDRTYDVKAMCNSTGFADQKSAHQQISTRIGKRFRETLKDGEGPYVDRTGLVEFGRLTKRKRGLQFANGELDEETQRRLETIFDNDEDVVAEILQIAQSVWKTYGNIYPMIRQILLNNNPIEYGNCLKFLRDLYSDHLPAVTTLKY